MARRNRLADLTPYRGCQSDEFLGIDPLAVGWLQRKIPFETGKPPKGFADQLLQFCSPENQVCKLPKQQPCPITNQLVTVNEFPLGFGEIRVIGEEDIFAAPDLIYHYVTALQYLPPSAFIDAVLKGPQPTSAEYKALLRVYV